MPEQHAKLLFEFLINPKTRLKLITLVSPLFSALVLWLLPGVGTVSGAMAGYRFGALADIVDVGAPMSVTLSPVDGAGNVVEGASGTVNLSLVLPTGGTVALSPDAVVLQSGSWAGSITLPAVATGPLRLRAMDAAGNWGDSTYFDPMRSLKLTVANMIWDASRSRFYASVPSSGGNYADSVVAIDPSTLQVTASVAVGQNPNQLVLTTGGEYLYVSQDASGSYSKIDAATLTVLATYALGTTANSAPLYVRQMLPVAGQPDAVVITQNSKENNYLGYYGIAVFDNGVARPQSRGDITPYYIIMPSADPAVIFAFGLNGYNGGSAVYQLQVNADGITSLISVAPAMLVPSYGSMESAGKWVASGDGVMTDAMNGYLSLTYTLPYGGGVVRPDLASNEVFFLEPQTPYSSAFGHLSAHRINPSTLIRRLAFATPFTQPGSLIRWGVDGLAFKTSDSVVVVNSGQLFPQSPEADLSVAIDGTSQTGVMGESLSYTVKVTNPGPKPAHNVLLSGVPSADFSVQSAFSGGGVCSVDGNTVSLPVGDLAPGASASLTVTMLPLMGGSLTYDGFVSSTSQDPGFLDNHAKGTVNVTYQSVMDVVYRLRLGANNLLYDRSRNLLWAAVPGATTGYVVSIDPLTGAMVRRFNSGGIPYANSMALSGNGRYLYLGLTNSRLVDRFDLNSTAPAAFIIPLSNTASNRDNFAQDIEVLDGDGTSFMMVSAADLAVSVYDGKVKRPTGTGIYVADRIVRTANPNVYVSYSRFGRVSSLLVDGSGVSDTKREPFLFASNASDVKSSGNFLLSANGELADINSLTLIAKLGISGRPCLDAPNRRAYLVNGGSLAAFDTSTLMPAGSLNLPTAATGDWAQSCIRWGVDGFGVLGGDGVIYITRWSAVDSQDLNSNGIADSWEQFYFNSTAADMNGDDDKDGISNGLEYLFGTSPGSPSRNPLHVKASVLDIDTSRSVVLAFPRRTGLAAGFYHFESTTNLHTWTPVQGVTERVVATTTVDGVAIDNVEASVPLPVAGTGFVRLVTVP